MNTYSSYLIYFVPFVFIALSFKYRLRLEKLRGSGKIPYIIGARQRQILFFVLALLSALILIIV